VVAQALACEAFFRSLLRALSHPATGLEMIPHFFSRKVLIGSTTYTPPISHPLQSPISSNWKVNLYLTEKNVAKQTANNTDEDSENLRQQGLIDTRNQPEMNYLTPYPIFPQSRPRATFASESMNAVFANGAALYSQWKWCMQKAKPAAGAKLTLPGLRLLSALIGVHPRPYKIFQTNPRTL
jgi:hypothetical protein